MAATASLSSFYIFHKKNRKSGLTNYWKTRKTAWRVSEGDQKRNREYKKYIKYNEEMLQQTDTDYAPWTIVEAMEKDYAAVKIISTVRKRTGI